MQFTDSHCHLDHQAFKEQLPQLLEQCHFHHINRIIIPAIAPDNFSAVLSLSQQYHNKPIKLYACLGIHPWFLQKLNHAHLALLSKHVSQARNNIVAVGEIGIDGAIVKRAQAYGQTPEENLAQQQHFFEFQLNLAKQHNLPVIVHHRQSHDKILPLLKKYQLNRAGIIHGFSGSYQQAKAYVDLGYKLGVGSTITYARAKKTINTIKQLPLTSLVLETDAPSMPVSKEVLTSVEINEALRANNKPENTPINLIKVFEQLVLMRSETAEDIAIQLEENIHNTFFSSFQG